MKKEKTEPRRLLPPFLKRFCRIDSFERVTLRISGMRHVICIEITEKENMAEVSEYTPQFSGGQETRTLKRRVECSKEEILKLLNRSKLLAWDGFSGKHPRHVLDGTMFRLDAVVNGGTTVHANGSQNFPRHYHDLTDELEKILERKPL